eukprot:TRINITY_DN62331_c0_g1_i1.p1 TRINITY_DN62331_c0_g1~~TRINITY_DN62331_c0_g1_i1.p1  ORF type:complete len:266 (+),score=60.39 TRINITY_DN62331_c0_g1_i1:45-800(+)
MVQALPARRRLSRPLLGLLCSAAVLLLANRSISAGLQLLFSSPQVSPPEPGRRQALLSTLAAGAASAGAAPAGAEVQKLDTKKTEVVQAQANPKTGIRGYLFEKPAGFKRFASPVDPSGYVFRSTGDTYFTFATRSEARPNASNEFKPEDFIADYRGKFVNATGSSFDLIKGGGPPTRVDPDLGVKYYEVEYVIRTQLGFSFDSLKTLHFITTFAVSADCINIMNCQALDDKWDKDGPVMQRVTQTFTVTG